MFRASGQLLWSFVRQNERGKFQSKKIDAAEKSFKETDNYIERRTIMSSKLLHKYRCFRRDAIFKKNTK